MKNGIAGLKPSHLDRDDIKKKNFLLPATVTEGAPSVTKLHFPVVGFKGIFEQQVGPVSHTGVVAGLLEESTDDSTYTTVLDRNGVAVALAAAQTVGGNIQQAVVISKPYVRYTATVTGDGSGTAVVGASLVF